jgi:Cu/Ag efflux protein CusF
MRGSRVMVAAASMVGLLSLASVALAQAPAKPAAQAKGEAVVASVKVTATVTQIDQATRAVTLKAEDGKEYSFVAGDAVKNLAQVQKGDVVTATYTEALAYEVKKGGTAGAGTMIAGGTAKAGAKPAGAIAQQTTVTVTITAIDPKAPSVTFKGPAGNTKTIKVMHPEKLQGVSVGDTVDITYTEALAITVEKVTKK